MSEKEKRVRRQFGRRPFLHLEDIPETSDIRAIKYLSCQGGGMKGIGYVGAIRELDDLGVLSQLEEVAGSSAGGMFALMIAIGCTADELAEEMLNMDFRSFQDKRELGWVEASKLGSLFEGLGGLAEETSRIKVLNQVVKQGLKTAEKVVGVAEKAEDLAGLAFGSQLGLWEGDALTHYLASLVARKTGNPNITFRELAALGPPFKKLTLTGSNLTTGKLEYYNAQNTPDMPIIQAARISASFPGAYKPVILEDGQVRVDGGLLENLPEVFNKEPYTPPDPANGQGGNKYAFALSFTSKAEKQPKKIKGIGQMLGAMYEAKTSEGAWKEKYGDNMADIDTVEMGTLEFEATEEKKQALIDSGKNAVRNAFKRILKQERKQEEPLSALEDKELIRIKVALENDSSEEGRELSADVFEELVRRAEENILGLEKQEDLERRARNALKRREKFGKKKLTDEELSEACSEKIKKLDNIVEQLEENLKTLMLSKDALEFNRDLIVEKLAKKDPYLWRALEILRKFNEDIRQSLLNKDIDQHKVLKSKRKTYYENLIAEYEKKDGLLAGFIRDLQEDSRRRGFVVPIFEDEVSAYCDKDIEACEEYIKEIAQELARKTAKLSDVRKLQKAAQEREGKATHYQALIDLNNELDKTIQRRTTVLTKVNHFLIQKAPRFERAILSFSKMVAFVSFVCWIPVAVGPVLTAKAIRHFSSNPAVKATADNVVDFFRLTNVESEHQIRVLRDRTAKTIETMSDIYAEAKKDETTSLYIAYQAYLGNSGVKMKEIFMKTPGESKADYQKRVREVKAKFMASIPPGELSKVEKADQNLEKFQKEVVLKISERKLTSQETKQSQISQPQLDMSSTPEQRRIALTAFHDARKKHGQEHGKMSPIKPNPKKK